MIDYGWDGEASYVVMESHHPSGGWMVLRQVNSNGWHIATYNSKEHADEVADFLTCNVGSELRG